jgi:hypothetical protein
MSDRKPAITDSPIALISEQWMKTCFMPWTALNSWNAFWGDQWKGWLKGLETAPNPWLAPLAGGRTDRRVEVDFFLPWLPRVQSGFESAPVSAEKAMLSAMFRAAMPQTSAMDSSAATVVAEVVPEPLLVQVVNEGTAPGVMVPASGKTVRKSSARKAGAKLELVREGSAEPQASKAPPKPRAPRRAATAAKAASEIKATTPKSATAPKPKAASKSRPAPKPKAGPKPKPAS